MGLIENKIIRKDCSLGTWEITRDFNTLLQRTFLTKEELQALHKFKNYNRKLEYLSVRALLNEMAGQQARIIYDSTNKPYLQDGSHQISISHSHQLTSILLSKKKRVGIDLEYMSHRISKIADRFIHPGEKITSDPGKKRSHLYIHWCAKEALYKICDKNLLNFRKNLYIEPFEVANRGSLKGWVLTSKREESYDMNYFFMDNYIIVYCCK